MKPLKRLKFVRTGSVNAVLTAAYIHVYHSRGPGGLRILNIILFDLGFHGTFCSLSFLGSFFKQEIGNKMKLHVIFVCGIYVTNPVLAGWRCIKDLLRIHCNLGRHQSMWHCET